MQHPKLVIKNSLDNQVLQPVSQLIMWGFPPRQYDLLDQSASIVVHCSVIYQRYNISFCCCLVYTQVPIEYL